MAHNQAPEKLREPLRDALLRCVDWRFLLPGVEPPWSISLVSGRVAEAVRLVSATESDILMRAGEAAVCDLVVIGRPTHAALRRAHAALQPGGAVYCEWALPRPGGAWRARRALRRAGFDEVHLHWPWPPPQRSSPHFWLPLDSAAAAAHLLALRPVRHRREVLLRRLWRIASLVGAVAPLSAIGRRSPAAAADSAGTDSAPAEEIETLLDALALGRESGVSGIPARRSWLLLTGGSRSINKVVGLPFSARDPIPRLRPVDRAPERAPSLGRRQVEHTGHAAAARPRAADREQAPRRLDRQLDLDRYRQPLGSRIGWPEHEVGTMQQRGAIRAGAQMRGRERA